ncbi:MAG: T9SS type B sorting domain-containing protein, partial [Bacteroidota bacterium]
DIDASAAVLALLGESGFTLQMQIGPNGNIYFLEDSEELGQFGLSEIVCPSATNPQFNRFLLELPTPIDIPYSGLPNFVDAIFADLATTGDTIRITNDSLEFCFGDQQPLIPSNLGVNYAWSNGQATQTIDVTESGQYQVTITGDCDPIVETFIVNELPEFRVEINFFEGPLLCPGDSIDLFFTANQAVLNTFWNGVEGDSSIRVAYLPNEEVVLRVSNPCGEANDTFTLPPAEMLTAELLTNFTTPLCPGDPVEFTVEGDFIDAVLWEDSSRGIMRTVDADSNLVYQATVFSRCNDSLTLVSDLNYSFCPVVCSFQLPELITPNGDGVNDLFKVYTPCAMEDYQLRIYNRWGQVLFESSEPSIGWDGTHNDVPQATDRYLYQVQFRFPNNPDVEQKDGSFSLIR